MNRNGGLHTCARDARVHYIIHVHTYTHIWRERERESVQKESERDRKRKKRADETDLVSVLSWRPYLLYVVALIT